MPSGPGGARVPVSPAPGQLAQAGILAAGVSCPHAPDLNADLAPVAVPDGRRAGRAPSGRDGLPSRPGSCLQEEPDAHHRSGRPLPHLRLLVLPRLLADCTEACAPKSTPRSATPTPPPTTSGSSTGSAATTCPWRRSHAGQRLADLRRPGAHRRCGAAARRHRSSPSARKASCTSPRPAGTTTTASACAASSSPPTSNRSTPPTARCASCRARSTPTAQLVAVRPQCRSATTRRLPGELPGYVADTSPGDVIAFDLHTFHAVRRAGPAGLGDRVPALTPRRARTGPDACGGCPTVSSRVPRLRPGALPDLAGLARRAAATSPTGPRS